MKYLGNRNYKQTNNKINLECTRNIEMLNQIQT